MKQNQKITPAQKACHFNISAITDEGSAITTQVWDDYGSPSEAINYLLQWHYDGLKKDGWNRPIVHGYIHCTATKETYFFDLTNPSHLETLSLSPKQ